MVSIKVPNFCNFYIFWCACINLWQSPLAVQESKCPVRQLLICRKSYSFIFQKPKSHLCCASPSLATKLSGRPLISVIAQLHCWFGLRYDGHFAVISAEYAADIAATRSICICINHSVRTLQHTVFFLVWHVMPVSVLSASGRLRLNSRPCGNLRTITWRLAPGRRSVSKKASCEIGQSIRKNNQSNLHIRQSRNRPPINRLNRIANVQLPRNLLRPCGRPTVYPKIAGFVNHADQ